MLTVGIVLNSTGVYQRGLTLAELVVVIAILAVAMVGVASGIFAAISRTSDVMVETRAVALAQSYLDEILGKRFDEQSAPRGIPPCNPCTAQSGFGTDGAEAERDDFDDVDDYQGLDEGDDPLNPLLDSEGNPRPEYNGFRVTVDVRYLEPCGAEALMFNLATNICSPVGQAEIDAAEPVVSAASRVAKLITVTVYARGEDSGWPFSVYKSNF